MSIRPVEFSGVVQRSQDVSTVKQQEDNKSMLQQQNVQTQFSKETAHHMRQVTHANDSDNEDRRNRKKKAEEKNSGKVSVKTTGGFDMKI